MKRKLIITVCILISTSSCKSNDNSSLTKSKIEEFFSKRDFQSYKLYDFKASMTVTNLNNSDIVKIHQLNGSLELSLKSLSHFDNNIKRIYIEETTGYTDLKKESYDKDLFYKSITWADENGVCIETFDNFAFESHHKFFCNKDLKNFTFKLVYFNANEVYRLQNFKRRIENNEYLMSTASSSICGRISRYTYADPFQTKFGVGLTVHKDDGVTIDCMAHFVAHDVNKPLIKSPLSDITFTPTNFLPPQKSKTYEFDLFYNHDYLNDIVLNIITPYSF